MERNRGAAFIPLLTTGIGIFGIFLFLTYYLQLSLVFTPVKTGLAFLPMVAARMVGTLASSAATDYLAGKDATNKVVQANAMLESHSTACWWSAGFIVAGMVMSALLYRRGKPAIDENAGAASTVHT